MATALNSSPRYVTSRFWRGRERSLRRQLESYGQSVEPHQMHKNRYAAAQALGKRSGFEVRVARELDAQGVGYKYEGFTILYNQPAKTRRYTPDFPLPNGIVVELKGRWVTADRQKMTMVRAQHPDIDIRMVFENPNARISSGSKTTYADVCIKLGIPYAAKSIPLDWIQEPVNLVSLEALQRAINASSI